MTRTRHFAFLYAAVTLLLVVASPTSSPARGVSASVLDSRTRMALEAGAPVRMTESPITGLATFVAAAPGKPIPTYSTPIATVEARGRKFLELYGAGFGTTREDQLRVESVHEPDDTGLERVRFRQLHHGVPVMGGEIIVHLRGTDVTAVIAETLGDLDAVDTSPAVQPQDATGSARRLLAEEMGVDDASFGEPRLEIFNRGMLDGSQSPSLLAWAIEASGAGLRERIWIDAHDGSVLLHFSQMTDARSRTVYDANDGSVLPGTLVRSEGGPATGDSDADDAYDFAGDAYDYFFTQHDRDSYDDLGSAMASVVHYCPTTFECPWDNAAWDGTRMLYGEGFSAADDVAAHELTHAVTETSAHLVYFMQSGALNESISDIFGETMDLTNGDGTDTSGVRWQIGEDLPARFSPPIRNMKTPTLHDQPGKSSDPQFVCNDLLNDLGGVHTNSGVPNHAYVLMVDGGSYNGQTVASIGLTKAAAIHYRALTAYLLSTSDFQAYHEAVQQACVDLVGVAGVTASDCTQVTKALDAVEMDSPPCSPPDAAPLCAAGQNPVDLFFDDLENVNAGRWAKIVNSGFSHWQGCEGNPDIYCVVPSPSGFHSFWGFDYEGVADSAVAMTSSVLLPADAFLRFSHAFNFEYATSYYDGGVLEYSVNNGASWLDAGSFIDSGASYAGAISTFFGNPLAGRQAFVGGSSGYTGSRLNLATLSGKNVRFRFRVGTDVSGADTGWFIDDIRLYTCTGSLSAPGNLGAMAVSPTRVDLSWSDNSSGESGFRIQRKTGVAGVYASLATVGAGVTGYSDVSVQASSTYYYRVRAYDEEGNSDFSNEASATTPAVGTCGNGSVSGAEQCDDGDAVFSQGDYCAADCKLVPCGLPTQPGGTKPKASDALFALRAAVGLEDCDVRVCDVNGSSKLNATDALVILRVAVGNTIAFVCPD